MKDTDFTIHDKTLDTPRGRIAFSEFIPESGDKAPCVLMSHGFNSCMGELADVAKVLAAHGVAAVCYDFNGGGNKGKSSGKTTDMSVATEQEDLRDMAAYVRQQPYAGRLYLYGESQGGFVSALTAPELNDISGLFLVYPAFVIPHDWLSKSVEELGDEFEFMNVKLSMTYYNGVPRYDVFAKAAEFGGAVKIWHGGADNIVDPEYSLKLVKSYADCELTVFSGLGHWFPPELRERIAKEIAGRING
ncbi:alpha/beta hydrolase [uncultured Ruminococcus sp.]|uniref:alpha/beta hydrolase n=1 Tax=uncultured Ruminococcus sp. TaxID=165186 RepID=UPI0025DC9436|nr:alpha/beta fold hydrolase [uncultured Ruminococcus sp.]